MITARDIEEVEKQLSATTAIVPGSDAIYFDRYKIDRDAFEAFLRDRRRLLTRTMPIDPRAEPPLNTMLRHFFLVGVATGRRDESR